jgi:hypothetical protein
MYKILKEKQKQKNPFFLRIGSVLTKHFILLSPLAGLRTGLQALRLEDRFAPGKTPKDHSILKSLYRN